MTRLELTPLELAAGTPLGLASVPRLKPSARADPRAALEELVRHALSRPPCLIAFSGGRDSSVILAVAAHVARRDGFPLPIPVTQVFPAAADAEESQWQQNVVEHLKLRDWERLTWTTELDVVGPYAERVTWSCGPYAPANLHFLLPLIDRARQGSLLTGSGGDELFGLASRPVAARVLDRPGSFRLRDVRGVVGGLLVPRWARSARIRRAGVFTLDWLTPDGLILLNRAFSDWMSRAPLRYDDALCDWLWRGRGTQLGLQVLSQLGVEGDARVLNPFEHPLFLSDYAGLAGRVGTGGRGRTLRALAGDLLPADLLARTSKAAFREAFVTARARDVVAHGLDETGNPFVDEVKLRAAWREKEIRPQSLPLLQAAAFRNQHGG